MSIDNNEAAYSHFLPLQHLGLAPLVMKWIEKSGVTWTVQRLKLLYKLRLGLTTDHCGVKWKKRLNRPAGPFGALWDVPLSKAVHSLRLYKVLENSNPSYDEDLYHITAESSAETTEPPSEVPPMWRLPKLRYTPLIDYIRIKSNSSTTVATRKGPMKWKSMIERKDPSLLSIGDEDLAVALAFAEDEHGTVSWYNKRTTMYDPSGNASMTASLTNDSAFVGPCPEEELPDLGSSNRSSVVGEAFIDGVAVGRPSCFVGGSKDVVRITNLEERNSTLRRTNRYLPALVDSLTRSYRVFSMYLTVYMTAFTLGAPALYSESFEEYGTLIPFTLACMWMASGLMVAFTELDPYPLLNLFLETVGLRKKAVGRQVSMGFRPVIQTYAFKESKYRDPVGLWGVVPKSGTTLRVVTLSSALTQWRLHDIGEALWDLLDSIPQDTRFTQSVEGLEGPYMSFDLTAATHRFPVKVSWRLLTLLFGENRPSRMRRHSLALAVVGEYARYMGTEKEERIAWSVGQPLGNYASFPLFSICHHWIVWDEYRKLYGHYPTRGQGYRMLGDDVIFNDSKLSERYSKVMRSYGVEVKSFDVPMFAGKVLTEKGWIVPFKYRPLTAWNAYTLSSYHPRFRRFYGPKADKLDRIASFPFSPGHGQNPLGIPFEDRYMDYLFFKEYNRRKTLMFRTTRVLVRLTALSLFQQSKERSFFREPSTDRCLQVGAKPLQLRSSYASLHHFLVDKIGVNEEIVYDDEEPLQGFQSSPGKRPPVPLVNARLQPRG